MKWRQQYWVSEKCITALNVCGNASHRHLLEATAFDAALQLNFSEKSCICANIFTIIRMASYLNASTNTLTNM